MLIIPSINETTLAEVQEKLHKAESFLRRGDWIQLDIADGVFTDRRTWGAPDELATLRTSLCLELHLMIAEPERTLPQYLDVLRDVTSAPTRVIVQYEAMRDPGYILAQCREQGVMPGLSLAPDTDPEFLKLYLRDFSFLNLLAVPPAPSGQRFLPSVIPKIQLLKAQNPHVIIEVDGGITPETARLVKDAGADAVVSGSSIFESPSPREAYEELRYI